MPLNCFACRGFWGLPVIFPTGHFEECISYGCPKQLRLMLRQVGGVFCSYAHEDEALHEELEKHLSMLQANGVIDSWHDRAIPAGKEWASEMNEHLNSAQIILLLISPDFLVSKYYP